MEFHNPFLMKGSVWRGINAHGLLITWSTFFFALSALSFFLNLFTWEKRTREHIKEATLQNTPTSRNISILWFFFKAERCSYREEKSISTLTRPVNYIRGHLEPVGDGSSNCMQTKQKKGQKHIVIKLWKSRTELLRQRLIKRTAEKWKKHTKCPQLWYKIAQNNTQVLSFFLSYSL